MIPIIADIVLVILTVIIAVYTYEIAVLQRKQNANVILIVQKDCASRGE
jgi:uncharacterized protein YacL